MTTKQPTEVYLTGRKGKRGTSYRLRWIDPRTGRWRSESCGRDLAYARARRSQLRSDLRDGLTGEIPDTPVADFIEMLKTLMAGKSPTNTIDSTQRSFALLARLCSVEMLADVDRSTVMQFRAHRLRDGVTAATINKDLRQIRSALSYAMDAGLTRTNPLLRWKQLMLREPERTIRVVEPAEFEKLLDACDDEMLAGVLVLAYRQGLRRGELVQLRWTAVDLADKTLHVINVPEANELTKSRKNRSLPMHPHTLRTLKELWKAAPKRIANDEITTQSPHVFHQPNGKALKRDWVSRYFREVVSASGVASCTLHDLRRSFSTLALRAGIDKHVVKELGGWSDVSVLERYYTGDVGDLYRKAMDRIARAV